MSFCTCKISILCHEFYYEKLDRRSRDHSIRSQRRLNENAIIAECVFADRQRRREIFYSDSFEFHYSTSEQSSFSIAREWGKRFAR